MYNECENDIIIFLNFIRNLNCYECASCVNRSNKDFTSCYCNNILFFNFINIDRYSIFIENYYLIINIFKPFDISKIQCLIFANEGIQKKKIFEFNYLPEFIIDLKNNSNINYAKYLEDKIVNLLNFK